LVTYGVTGWVPSLLIALVGLMILLLSRRQKVPSWDRNFEIALGILAIVFAVAVALFWNALPNNATLSLGLVCGSIILALLVCVPFVSADKAKQIAEKTVRDKLPNVPIFNLTAKANNWTWHVTGQYLSGGGLTPFEVMVHTKCEKVIGSRNL